MKKLILSCFVALPFIATAQLPAGVIAKYPFDNNLSDIGGGSFNGSLNSTTAAADRFGSAGKATAFVQNTSTGTLPGTLQTAIKDNFSIGFWFKTTMTANSHTQWFGGNSMIDAEMCGGTTDWGIALMNGGKVAFGIGGGDITIISPLDYNNGSWHFVTVTRTSGTGAFALYINGIQVAANNIGTPGALTAPFIIGLGRNPCDATAKFSGSLDDIIIYDRQLSGVEVLNLYNFSSLTTLPLQWVAFTGQEKNNSVLLRWTIANMINTERFDIERSPDGRVFTTAGSVDADAGVTDYTFQLLNRPGATDQHYRIRQVDKDNNFSYSDIISIRTSVQTTMLTIARNPATAVVSINNPAGTTISHVTVVDAGGRKFISKQTASVNRILNVDISTLQPGQYFISMFHDGMQTVLPFLKQR